MINLDTVGAWIAPFEGSRSSAYDDATGAHIVPGYTVQGNPTVGIGINLCHPNGLDEAEIQWLFEHRVAKVAASLLQAMPWVSDLTPPRQCAMIDMAYNMGLPTLQTFHTFLACMTAGNYGAAADDLSGTLWARQVGGRAVKDIAAIRG